MVERAMAPVIVGRDAELRRIGQAFDQAADGVPQLLILLGEAGIGKTWLTREATARARAAGSHVLVGSCLDLAGGGMPYLPVAEALRGLARSVTPDELERVLGPARDDLAAIVPELGRPAADGPDDSPAGGPADGLAARSGGAPSGVNQARLFERFIGVLDRLGANRPLLAVVDDVQWIDRASRDLLTFLVRNITTEHLVAILTCRVDDLPRGHPVLAWLAELGRAPGGERIELGRLDEASVGRMREAFTGRPSRADETALLWRRSEGNPLFVAELLDVERSGVADSALGPASLVEILVARVAQLPPQARRLVDAIALAGRAVDERLLAAVVGVPEDVVARSMRQAMSGGVLVADPAGVGYRIPARDPARGGRARAPARRDTVDPRALRRGPGGTPRAGRSESCRRGGRAGPPLGARRPGGRGLRRRPSSRPRRPRRSTRSTRRSTTSSEPSTSSPICPPAPRPPTRNGWPSGGGRRRWPTWRAPWTARSN